MIERQNLSVLHAPLKISLSESACSHMTCQKGPGEHGGGAPIPPNTKHRSHDEADCIVPAEDTPHPNDRAVKPISYARDIDSQLARRSMLAQALSIAHIGSVCRM